MDLTQLLFETDFEHVVLWEKAKDWASSIKRIDPRYMIMNFFNDVAVSGAENLEDGGTITLSQSISPFVQMFRKSAVISVWRPTSKDSIRKMMTTTGTGKGLNIKGKSAKKGELSGYVPYVQIHKENHKRAIKPLPKNAMVRVFYRKWQNRDNAVVTLRTVAREMADAVREAKDVLSGEGSGSGCSREDAEWRMAWWDADDLSVRILDDYAKNKGWGPFAKGFGVEISERLFWEAYVCRQDITREAGSEHDTGRASIPEFQDMNFGSTRRRNYGCPKTVVWQHADPKKGHSPMDPRTLVVAYEENKIVLPVVSDFDCFLLGTRGVTFSKPLPHEQIDLVNWEIDNIENILRTPSADEWAQRWLGVLKNNNFTGPASHMPNCGYGDPKTYKIMELAVKRLGSNGAVRHGAECFNFGFPQDLDDQYLIVLGDALAGEVPWKYVSEPELRDLLLEKIQRGFVFPINPKWVLADPGWKEVFDKLMASQEKNVQCSLDCWFPPSSGIRERIEEISKEFPSGFEQLKHTQMVSKKLKIESESVKVMETEKMDLELEFVKMNDDNYVDKEED